MERKKILGRAAVAGGAVVVAALVAIVVSLVGERRAMEHRRAARDAHVASLTKEYQAYLDETAQKIKGLPVDPRVIADVQTRHFQQRPALWLYVWADDNQGAFLFGVPADAFGRLNVAFDQNREVIARDNHFANRDQFLRTFLHDTRRIAPASPDGDVKEKTRDDDAHWWRFHGESDEGRSGAERSNVLFLSSPIQDEASGTVGTLNLKLVDAQDQALYSLWGDSGWRDLRDVAAGVFAFACAWLWFLLPSWVYIDAQEYGVPRPLLWALLTLIGSVFALMVYLVSRPPGPLELRCPQCSKPLSGSKAGCPYCGADLSSAFCAQCQYPVKPDWSFCPSCRSALARRGNAGGNTSGGSTSPSPRPEELPGQ